MVTFYVLYDAFTRMFVRAGSRGLGGYGWTFNLSEAKHFTSEWSANRYISCKELSSLVVKKIERY